MVVAVVNLGLLSKQKIMESAVSPWTAESGRAGTVVKHIYTSILRDLAEVF